MATKHDWRELLLALSTNGTDWVIDITSGLSDSLYTLNATRGALRIDLLSFGNLGEHNYAMAGATAGAFLKGVHVASIPYEPPVDLTTNEVL